MATKVDVRVGDGFFKGTNFTFDFQSLDEDGNPENISGFTLRYDFLRRPDDTVPLFTKTIGSGIVLTEPLIGKGQVVFVPGDTSALKAGMYFHKLARTDTGFVSSIIPGKGHPAASVTLLAAA